MFFGAGWCGRQLARFDRDQARSTKIWILDSPLSTAPQTLHTFTPIYLNVCTKLIPLYRY